MRNDREKLEKILECIEWVQEYAKSGKNNFLADHKTQDAMIRNCQIVGEAVKGLSNELRLNTPEVDWRSPARFRDKITHDYFDINLEQVWEICEGELIAFGQQVKKVLESLSSPVKDSSNKPTLAEKLKEQDHKNTHQ